MKRYEALLGRRTPGESERMGLDDLAQMMSTFQWNGLSYATGLNTTYGKTNHEPIEHHFGAYVNAAYKANGIIFACILARATPFADVRFAFQRFENGRPGGLYSTPALDTLHKPWPGGSTGMLLTRMEQDASLAGNAYVWRSPSGALKRLRPDWVEIIIGSPDGDPNSLAAEVAGYLYTPGGPGGGKKPITLLAADVAHYAPNPDPEAHYRGMSWLSPVVTEIEADSSATRHKRKFFDNAATPNLAVSFPKEMTAAQVREYAQLITGDHAGAANAYKTLFIGGGADPKVIGADMRQIDFKVTQGAGETRIAAAAGVPPIIVGLSEGLDASTYSNYGQARRKFADTFLRSSWRQACAALETICPPPDSASRLWYDARDCSFLQEDEADAAQILKEQMLTIESAVRAGYTPESAVAAVDAGDLTLMEHTGLYSVQLQPPGANGPTPAA